MASTNIHGIMPFTPSRALVNDEESTRGNPRLPRMHGETQKEDIIPTNNI